MSTRVLIINGVNLNLLGKRETGIYGSDSLSEIEQQLQIQANNTGVDLHCFQSNAEHEIVEKIHSAKSNKKSSDNFDYIIINAGAHTHTSIAIRDALVGVEIPFIEVHLSNTKSREYFRHKSYLSDKAMGIIEGFGKNSYFLALQSISMKISN